MLFFLSFMKKIARLKIHNKTKSRFYFNLKLRLSNDSFFTMKNLCIFFIIVMLYTILVFLDESYITTNSKIFYFLSQNYPNDLVQDYMKSSEKWKWVGYVITPLLIGVKVLSVAFCLNFLKLFELPGIDKINIADFISLVLISEVVFIIGSFYKFIYFYWLNTHYTLEDVQTYYPLSLLNFKENISTEKWLAYPLQLVNIFELFYWILLAWGGA